MEIIPLVQNDRVADLSVSVVTYSPDIDVLRQTIHSLQRSVTKAAEEGVVNCVKLVLVDHGPGQGWRNWMSTVLVAEWAYDQQLLSAGDNYGFGVGHNMAVAYAKAPYHLILNPDTVLGENAIAESIRYMEQHPTAGLITPKAFWPTGERQYLCKRYPSIVDLLLRGFAPKFAQRLAAKRLWNYEMRGITEECVVNCVPIASGCFMFLRRAAFDAVGSFSPRFFLYFEDFDLCIRLRESGWGIAYVPSVVITHHGGNAARKGLWHVLMFISSATWFFNLHGWKVM